MICKACARNGIKRARSPKPWSRFWPVAGCKTIRNSSFWKGFNCFCSKMYSTRSHLCCFMVRNLSLSLPLSHSSQHFNVPGLSDGGNAEVFTGQGLSFVCPLLCHIPGMSPRNDTGSQSSVCFVSRWCFKIKCPRKLWFFPCSLSAGSHLLPISVFLGDIPVSGII